MSLSGTHLLPQEACRAEISPAYKVVASSFTEANSNPDKQASPVLVDQPQAARVQRAPARNAAQELHEQQVTGLQQPERSTTQQSPAAGEQQQQQQNGLKAMPQHQDSAGSSYTAVAARTGSSSPSARNCMAQKEDAVPQQMPGTATKHAGSGSTAASSSPKSGSVDPSTRSSLTLAQSHVDVTQKTCGGAVGSGQQHKQQASKEKATAKLNDMDPSYMPIARFDPSLVAAVKCAADILQTDDGWSKEEAAATIAALTAKFQNNKSKSAAAAAAAAAASAGRAAVDAAEVAHCMQGQPGSLSSHSSGARAAGVSSLPRQDSLGGWQVPRLHPFLPSLAKPALSAGTGSGALKTASSKPAGTADGVLGATAGSSIALGNLNGLPMATGIPAWCAGTDRRTPPTGRAISDCPDDINMAAAGGANRLYVACSMGSPALRPTTQQPSNSGAAAGSGMNAATCSSSSGALDVQQEGPAAAALPAARGDQAADAGGGRAEAASDATDPAGAVESGFASKPSTASSGVCSVMEPRPAAEDLVAAAAATQQHQQAQQQQEIAASPVLAARRGFQDAATAATVAAAAASAAAVHAALQREEHQQQLAFDRAAGATKSDQVQIGVSRHVASGLFNTSNQSAELSVGTSSQPQMPASVLGLLQPGQPQALPLMSALLRSGDLPPVVAESLRARMGGYLQQQQQQSTAGAGSAGQAASIAAAALASSGAAGVIGNKQQQEAQAVITMQQSLQQQEQQQQEATMQLVMQQRLQAAQQEQYQLQQYKQQQQMLMQMDAPAESESRSVESIAAATSHASADAPVPEPAGRRKRGRQPSAKAAAAAAAAQEERATKRQAKASKHDVLAASPRPTQVAPKGKRGRPSNATKAAAAAAARAAEAAGDNRLEHMHCAAPDRWDGIFADVVGATAAAADGAACSVQDQNAWPTGREGAAAEDQQQQVNDMAIHGMGLAGDYFPHQHAMRSLQQQHMQLEQQQQQQPLQQATQPDAAAAAAQQQFQQQLHQLPPINTGAPGCTSAATGTDAQQLLQQLQQLPAAAAQHVAKIAQQLPPDLTPQMRQSLLRWAVNTVTQQMGPTEDANPPIAPQQQQQQQPQLPQQGPAAAATAAAMWSAAGSAAATAAVVSAPAATSAATAIATAPPATATGLVASLQPWNCSTAMVTTSTAAAAVQDRDIMSGLLAAAQNYPSLRNLQPQERKACLERLLQQRNERLFAQSLAQQQQSQGQQRQQQLLDHVAAAAAPPPVANWLQRQQQQQIQQQTSLVGSHAAAAAAAACVPMSVQVPCPTDPAVLAAQEVSQSSAMAAVFTGIGTLRQAGSLPLPKSTQAANATAAASLGALGGRGSGPAVLHHAAAMPEALGESAAAGGGGSGNFAAAAAAPAMQRPQLHGINLKHLEYQLQAHGMSKKQLLELMKGVGPIAALNSIGIQPNQAALHGQGRPAAPAGAAAAAKPMDAAAAAAMPANFGVPLQQQVGQQQQMLVNQRLQQLSGMAGQSSAMFGLPQPQQQHTNWMLGGNSANMLSPSAGLDMSGTFGPDSHTASNYGPAANGLGANMLQCSSMQHAMPGGASGVGIAALADMMHQQIAAAQQHSSMMPSFPSSFDPAAAAAAPVSAAAVAARHMQLSGGGVHPGAAAAAGGNHAAASWMAASGGVAAAGFAAGFGHMTDNYNSNTAALDPPVLEMPYHLTMNQHTPAAGCMGSLQQHQQQRAPAMSSDLPGSSLTMPADAEDLLGMDMGDVDALLAAMDPGMIAADGGYPIPGNTGSIQRMHDVWSKAG